MKTPDDVHDPWGGLYEFAIEASHVITDCFGLTYSEQRRRWLALLRRHSRMTRYNDIQKLQIRRRIAMHMLQASEDGSWNDFKSSLRRCEKFGYSGAQHLFDVCAIVMQRAVIDAAARKVLARLLMDLDACISVSEDGEMPGEHVQQQVQNMRSVAALNAE